MRIKRLPVVDVHMADDLKTGTTLLDSLFKNGRIIRDQFKQMQPDIHKLEFAHLYFIAKAHKVT